MRHSKPLFSFFNGPTPASFSFIFGLFKQTIQFLQQINVKKCLNDHLVYGAEIWTHDLQNMSHHPLPLDQGSRPASFSLLSSFQQLTVNKCSTQKLILAGFKPGSFGTRSDCSANCATTTARNQILFAQALWRRFFWFRYSCLFFRFFGDVVCTLCIRALGLNLIIAFLNRKIGNTSRMAKTNFSEHTSRKNMCWY